MDDTKYIYDQRSLLSQLFFAWVIPLVKNLRSTEISVENLPEVPKELNFEEDYRKICKSWELEKNKPCPSFFRAMWRVKKWEFLVASVLMGLLFLSQISQSVLVYYLVKYFKDQEASAVYGVVLGGSFILIQLFVFLTANQGTMKLVIFSSKLKSWSCKIVSEKLLVTSNTELNSRNEGTKVSNIIGNDIELFEFVILAGNLVCIGPVLLTSIVVMYLATDIAGIIGIVFIGSQLPLMIFLGKITSSIRMILAKISDSRVKMISNLIEGIKMIKLYAWEKPLLDMIFRERAIEIREFIKMGWVQVTAKVLTMGMLAFSTIATLLIYVHQGNTLTSEVTFLTVGILHSLNTLFNYFGALGLRTTFLVYATFQRITEVLLLEEITPMPVPPSGFRGVRVKNATFSWKQ